MVLVDVDGRDLDYLFVLPSKPNMMVITPGESSLLHKLEIRTKASA